MVKKRPAFLLKEKIQTKDRKKMEQNLKGHRVDKTSQIKHSKKKYVKKNIVRLSRK